MSDIPVSPTKRSTPIATGVWILVAFAAVCSVAANHTMYSGIFPFVAVAVSLTLFASLRKPARS